MKEKDTNNLEIVDGEIVNEVEVVEPVKMEFRFINPTEDGFLKVIKWNKEELDTAVRQKIAEYKNVVYTDDNMKKAKADRAELNKLAISIDDRRKKVKKIINMPYETFESEVKDILALIQKPIETIDKQVKAYEDKQKEEKKKSIIASYDEVIGDLAKVLPFERIFDSRYLNQTYKLTTAIADIKAKVDKVRTDIETIDNLDSKYKLNAKDVYIKTLDLSKALAECKRLSDLEERMEAEKQRKAEAEAEKQRQEDERRKAAEERARETESQIKIQETSRKNERKAVNVSAGIPCKDVCELSHGIVKQTENVSGSAESVSKKAENVVAPPAGDASVTDPFASNEKPKQYKASFTVYGTKDQIMALKQYMIDNNITFGKVEK